MKTLQPISRRTFIAWVGGAGAGFYLFGRLPGTSAPVALAQVPGGTLDPNEVAKFVTPMLVPPVMPRAAVITAPGGKPVDYYEISMRQFQQQILPAGLPATTVWGYGGKAAQSNRGLLIHNAPSLTIEAMVNRPVRIKWINELVDANGNFLPHLLPVDPTLHWANPPGGTSGRDSRPTFTETPDRYTGPVPIVTHVHGAASSWRMNSGTSFLICARGGSVRWHQPEDGKRPRRMSSGLRRSRGG
jgi:spore coat protein A